ncbi:hypothetical protein LJK88_43760 [Paenibacillus sp. P26]|nr:hypothetical protein LJK88_43760 [Paenibacillus sp. P26]
MSTLANLQSHIPCIEFGSYPVRFGNAVHPLVDSAPTFRRICEAIEAAQYSVWFTVTFMAPDFQMPDGRGTILDVLDRAACSRAGRPGYILAPQSGEQTVTDKPLQDPRKTMNCLPHGARDFAPVGIGLTGTIVSIKKFG